MSSKTHQNSSTEIQILVMFTCYQINVRPNCITMVLKNNHPALHQSTGLHDDAFVLWTNPIEYFQLGFKDCSHLKNLSDVKIFARSSRPTRAQCRTDGWTVIWRNVLTRTSGIEMFLAFLLKLSESSLVFVIEVERAWARARRHRPNFWLAVNKHEAQGSTSLIFRKAQSRLKLEY